MTRTLTAIKIPNLNNKLLQIKINYLLISSNIAVLSLAFFIAIDSTCPWKTKKFLDFIRMPIFSKASAYSSTFTD